MQSRKGHTLKVIIIGDSCVGKTSILKSFCETTERNIREAGYIETIVKRNGQLFPLTIFDTGGQERFRSMTNSYYRGTKGCVLCFDVTKSESFNSLERWLKDLEDHMGNNISCVLVATRCDASCRKREISTEDVLAFAHKREIPLVELSSFDKQDVERIFKLLIDVMINRNLTTEGQNELTDTIKVRTRNQETNNRCSCL